MTQTLQQFSKTCIIIALMGSVGYFGVQALTGNPCDTPLTFSIGAIDERFGLSKQEILAYSTEAASVWNNAYATSTLLMSKDMGGDITITFIYDERQRTTIQNEKLKQSITNEKEELTELKETIESLRDRYNALEASVETRTSAYNERLAEYNNEVASWNKRGGAPNTVYQRLQREAAQLETERLTLNKEIDAFNALAEQIKSYGNSHNQIVATINEKINTLNETALRDFEEGTYDPRTKTITIYEYGSIPALKRVLVHEFGHALRLDHVNDEEAIMYPINQGKTLSLSEADRAELAAICKETTLEDLRVIRDGISRLVLSSWHDITARPQ